jgi:hypothetical protein
LKYGLLSLKSGLLSLKSGLLSWMLAFPEFRASVEDHKSLWNMRVTARLGGSDSKVWQERGKLLEIEKTTGKLLGNFWSSKTLKPGRFRAPALKNPMG